MILEQGHLYHIYNQGNNRQKIFFMKENYYFFLKKMETFIPPFADILAWCLMPNHFHIMVYVNYPEITVGVTARSETHPMTPSHRMSASQAPRRVSELPFNNSIAVLLRSYTRAINKQENRTGSLFKPHTKAECLTNSSGITPSFFNIQNGTLINIPLNAKEYPQNCFDYIHNNPVKANLVKHPADWEFSSYRDYCGMRTGKLINSARAKEFGIKW